MKLIKLWSVFIFFISLFVISLGCMPTKSRDTGNYVKAEKYKVPHYMEQEQYIKKCIEGLSPAEAKRFEDVKKATLDFAWKELTNLKGCGKLFIAPERGYKDCVAILSQHDANLALCPEFKKTYTDYDFLWHYAKLESTECVRQKG